MASRVVGPEEPSLVVVRETPQLPSLPRAEAQRLRRSVRGFADVLLPELARRAADIALSSENEKLALEAIKWLASISLRGKSNEDLDPEGPIVDAQSKEATDSALAKLEETTASEVDSGSE